MTVTRSPGRTGFVIVAGVWTALMWVLLVAALLLGDVLAAVACLFLLILPFGLIWRFIYWRADRRAGIRRGLSFREALQVARASGAAQAAGHQWDSVRYGEQSREYARTGRLVTDADAAHHVRSTVRPPTPHGWMSRLGLANLRLWVVMFFFPIRDAVAEIRAGRSSRT